MTNPPSTEVSRTKTVINFGSCLVPMLMALAIPALFMLALIVGQVVIYGGW